MSKVLYMLVFGLNLRLIQYTELFLNKKWMIGALITTKNPLRKLSACQIRLSLEQIAKFRKNKKVLVRYTLIYSYGFEEKSPTNKHL